MISLKKQYKIIKNVFGDNLDMVEVEYDDHNDNVWLKVWTNGLTIKEAHDKLGFYDNCCIYCNINGISVDVITNDVDEKQKKSGD